MVKRILSMALVLVFLCGATALAEENSDSAGQTSGNFQSFLETVNSRLAAGRTGAEPTEPPVYLDSDTTVTVMVYMDAADLESVNGAASADINEMLYADLRRRVNVVLCTGGTKAWQNHALSATTNEYHVINNGKLVYLGDGGQRDMTEGDTLRDFIRFAAERYPADRYVLILWDHGGGTMYGFGMDERFDPDRAMPVNELGDAISDSDVYFDIIGFDACLMATAETALGLAGCADYMVASEESEPGVGWYYTSWLESLARDPDMETERLGRAMIDSYFIKTTLIDPYETLTLSMIDLDVFQDRVLPALWAFSSEAQSLLNEGEFAAVSKARKGALEFGSNDFDQVDLVDFASRLGTASAESLIDAVTDAVIYNRSTRDRAAASGVAVYFPNRWLDEVDDVVRLYGALGWDDSYTDLVTAFASMQVLGRDSQSASSSGSLFSQPIDLATSEGYSWFDQAVAQLQAGYVQASLLDEDELTVFEKPDGDDYYFALSLSDDDWDLIADIQLVAFLDDGEGYIELGYDDVFDFDDDGDLIVEFDYTWLALDGHTVAYYAEEYVEDGDYYCYTGYVPAALNGEEVELVLSWDPEHEWGYVRGARPVNNGGVVSRRMTPLQEGDVIQPLCHAYDYDGEYDGMYEFGDPFVVYGVVQVSYEDIGDFDTAISYALIDIYGAEHMTEFVYYE